METEWDPDKAAASLEKHGVDFADAATALYDDHALTIRDESSGEERFVTIGVDALGRLLIVVFTLRGERVRIISARKATRRETRLYESGR
jgi:hypothetical protein